MDTTQLPHSAKAKGHAEAGDAPPAKKPSSGAGDDASKEDGADGE